MIDLQFDGQRYRYWQGMEIHDSVDDLCSAVSLKISGSGHGFGNMPLTANTEVKVFADGELVSTVRPDLLRRDVRENDHKIQVEARSLARELVDCQYSTTLDGLTLEDLIKRLCKTFKVPVKVTAKTAVVPHFSMQCELPANALVNAARAANLLLYPQPDGGLLLTAPTDAAPVATLEYGKHIKHYAVVDEFRLRFSEYRVKSFDFDGNQALKGDAKDDGITFFRPFHLVADRHGQELGGCTRRAEMERNRRLARAHRLELELAGWKHAGGLWAINTQVRVVIPQEGIDGVYLIGERDLTLDSEGGHVARLMLMHREAFLGEEKKRSKRAAGVGVKK